MIPIQLRPVANHLWQSTLFAAVAGVMALLLKKNKAQTRYRLWFAASIKFLVPLSVLTGIGGRLRWHVAPEIVKPVFSAAMQRVSEPFAAPTNFHDAVDLPHASSASLIPEILLAVWALGVAVLAFSWLVRWRKIRATLATASALQLPIDLKTLTSPAFGEPGVFGILRPVLLLPAGIFDHLTPPQLEAIVEHELCHVHRRDNLTAAIHMGVEAVFWFYPLVWWIGARLMTERECACDEEVLLRSEPQLYAEGILRICELYLRSPLPCVAGVTGSNLKRRMETIMSHRTAPKLNLRQKAALVVVCIAAIGLPLIAGWLNSPAMAAEPARQFENVSVKFVAKEVGWPPRAGYWVFPKVKNSQQFSSRIQLSSVIEWAYGVRDFQIVGGPDWIRDANVRFDIQAVTSSRVSDDVMRQMIQILLADRFNLKVHRQSEKVAIYALLVGDEGPKLKASLDTTLNDAKGEINIGLGNFIARGVTMSPLFTQILTENLDRPVIDKTNFTDHYDFTLNYQQKSPTEWKLGQQLFPMVAQLGLKLEPQQDTFEMLMIDSADRPTDK